MNTLFIARALHVLGVVIWIGGVYMATTIILPIVRKGELGQDRLAAFHAVESRFKWHARTAVIVVGVTGFYMVEKLHLWSRFAHAGFWWMYAMVLVWTLFAILLFVMEPLVLHRHFARWAEHDPVRAFTRLYWGHVVQVGS